MRLYVALCAATLHRGRRAYALLLNLNWTHFGYTVDMNNAKHEPFPNHGALYSLKNTIEMKSSCSYTPTFYIHTIKLNRSKMVLFAARSSFVVVYVATLSASVELELAIAWYWCRLYALHQGFCHFCVFWTFSETTKINQAENFSSAYHV